MARKDQQSVHPQDFRSENIVVIGAGPVGLVASLLLSKYQIGHMLVEQLSEPDNHPQAHFINCRSMEILRELDGLDQVVRSESAPTDEWRRFVYCTGLSDLPVLDNCGSDSTGSLLGMVDHFADPPAAEYSPSQVTHFPQHDFVRLLRRHVLKSKFCRFVEGCRADVREHPQHVSVRLSDRQRNRQRKIQSQFVLGADGAHSAVRKQIGIDLVEEQPNLQHLINVHFFSPSLAAWLQNHIPAMLYFVYSTAGVAVIVSHALQRGEFVAQIPFFPPHQGSSDFDENRCSQLLAKLAGRQFNINIKSIRTWRMGTGHAARFRSEGGRCFLIGDAAHQVTPAGGFGMNTGIQDAHNLIWKIALVLRREHKIRSDFSERLLQSYEKERQPVARLNADLSIQNFKKTLRVSSAIGLNLSAANLLSRVLARIVAPDPIRRTFFEMGMRLGLKQIDWLKSSHLIARQRGRALNRIFRDAKRQTLQLLFPGQDLGFTYREGLLVGKTQPFAGHFNPFRFEPSLVVGGRMPHFWLNGKNGRRISVLDLPTLMLGADGLPRHVLLVVGDTKRAIENRDEIDSAELQPVVRVDVSTNPDIEAAADFSIHQVVPEFLPDSFAVLMRPDGHIAWLQV